MAGEVEPVAGSTPPASATEAAAAASSPTAAAPAAAEPAAAPVVQPEPSAAPAAAVVEPAAPAAPVAEPTLLQKHDAEVAAAEAAAKPAEPAKAAEPAKPTEPAKAAEPAKPGEKPAEPAAAAAPVEPAAPPALEPVQYAYELPETIKLDDATRSTFHTALDAFRQDPAKGAQGLIDLHNTTMADYAAHVASEQQRVWNDTRKGWQTDVMADEQLGGAGFQTTMGAIARMRDRYVPEANRAAFDSFLQTTGAGDHPEFLRLLHNVARDFDEAPMRTETPRPTVNGGKPPSGRLRDMYSKRG